MRIDTTHVRLVLLLIAAVVPLALLSGIIVWQQFEAGHDASLLIRRGAELIVLMLIGVSAVAVGTSVAVAKPMKELSSAVRRWQAGGTFDPTNLDGAPSEIRELSEAFARATDALGEQRRKLRVASTQQELLMQEIHHRVKNNLQIVASLLNLQASRIKQPEAKAEFQSARDRIRALATLHRHLYAHGELHTINMRAFLRELCEQLLQAIGDGASNGDQRVQLDIEAPELQISSDQAVPIALIVTEAVSNAAKYAFPGERRGHIRVRLTLIDNIARLEIEDDGVGIQVGQADTELEGRDGLGRQLIRGFARQLGAKLSMTEENGTRYMIDIPLQRERPTDVPADPSTELDTNAAASA